MSKICVSFRWSVLLYIICDKTQSLSFNRFKTENFQEKKERSLLVFQAHFQTIMAVVPPKNIYRSDFTSCSRKNLNQIHRLLRISMNNVRLTHILRQQSLATSVRISYPKNIFQIFIQRSTISSYSP